MQRIKNIFIANIAEAFADLLEQTVLNNSDQQDRFQQEIDLSQRAQFWGGNDKIIITPEPIPNTLLKNNSECIGYKNITNLWPKNNGVQLCKSIMDDTTLIKNLIKIIRENPYTKISSYSFTDNYANLLRLLKSKVVRWRATNVPHAANPANLVKTIDSKSGFREIIADLFPVKNLRLPRGFICESEKDVLKAIFEFLGEGRGFVIKVHNGESGWGVKIVDDDTAQDLNQTMMREWLSRLFGSDPVWKFAPYVVEEFISVDSTIAGGFPSGEGHITNQGFIFDYECGQEVTKEGSFKGVVISSSILPSFASKNIKIAMEMIGKKFHTNGYRGIFDIDFAAGVDGNLYILESNARMTGGTHVYDIMSYLGLNGNNTYVLSNDSFCYDAPVQKPDKILALLSNIIYPINHQKRGLILSFISMSRPVIGIIVVGENREDARLLIHRAKDCFSAY